MALKNMKNRSTGKQETKYADRLNEMIRKKAFELYQKRGATPGKEMDDWFEAETIVKQELQRKKLW